MFKQWYLCWMFADCLLHIQFGVFWTKMRCKAVFLQLVSVNIKLVQVLQFGLRFGSGRVSMWVKPEVPGLKCSILCTPLGPLATFSSSVTSTTASRVNPNHRAFLEGTLPPNQCFKRLFRLQHNDSVAPRCVSNNRKLFLWEKDGRLMHFQFGIILGFMPLPLSSKFTALSVSITDWELSVFSVKMQEQCFQQCSALKSGSWNLLQIEQNVIIDHVGLNGGRASGPAGGMSHMGRSIIQGAVHKGWSGEASGGEAECHRGQYGSCTNSGLKNGFGDISRTQGPGINTG